MTVVTQSAVSRRARNQVETRKRILLAAIKTFGAKGIERATVDEIAAAADVGKGTIYNYFQTKEEIVVAFLVEVEHEVQKQVTALVGERRSLESALVRLVDLQFTLKAPHHAFVRVFLAQLVTRVTPDSPWIQQIQAVIDPPLRQLFSWHQQHGKLRRDIDIAALIAAFKVVHLGLTAVWAMEGAPWRGTDRMVKETIRLFVTGLEARS